MYMLTCTECMEHFRVPDDIASAEAHRHVSVNGVDTYPASFILTCSRIPQQRNLP